MTSAELRAWTTKHHYSNHALARALGCSRSTVERWRAGEANLSSIAVLALQHLTCRERWRSSARRRQRGY